MQNPIAFLKQRKDELLAERKRALEEKDHDHADQLLAFHQETKRAIAILESHDATKPHHPTTTLEATADTPVTINIHAPATFNFIASESQPERLPSIASASDGSGQ